MLFCRWRLCEYCNSFGGAMVIGLVEWYGARIVRFRTVAGSFCPGVWGGRIKKGGGWRDVSFCSQLCEKKWSQISDRVQQSKVRSKARGWVFQNALLTFLRHQRPRCNCVCYLQGLNISIFETLLGFAPFCGST